MPLINIGVTGGLNLSVHPSGIADNELTAAYNVVYEANSGVLKSREGISPLGDPLANPIEVLFPFTRKVGESWLIAASGNKLYKMDLSNSVLVSSDGLVLTDSEGNVLTTGGAEEVNWIEIASIESNRSSMIAFNGKLLVADGSVNGILSWDGTTASRISGSPQATALFEMKNRVVANSISDGDLDSVYLSKTEDETVWDPASGAAALKAGYGDGMSVNGFSSISNTLIVSKVAETNGVATKKKMFYVQIGATNVPEAADALSPNNAAIGPHAILGYQQDVKYLDAEGFESLNAVQAYGDIQNDPTAGGKVNREIKGLISRSDTATMCMLPRQAAVYMFFSGSDRVFVHSLLTKAFTEIDFNQRINYAADYGNQTYFAGDNGQLFFYNGSGTDNVFTGPIDVTSVVRSKLFEAPFRSILEKTWIRANYLASGTIVLDAYAGNARNKKLLMSEDFFAAADGDKELYASTGDLSSADGDIGGEKEARLESRSRITFEGLMLQLRVNNGGRCEFSGIDAQVKVVGR